MNNSLSTDELSLALQICSKAKHRIFDWPWQTDEWQAVVAVFGEVKAAEMKVEFESMRVAFFSIPHCPKNKSVAEESEGVASEFRKRFPNAPCSLVRRFESVFIYKNK